MAKRTMDETHRKENETGNTDTQDFISRPDARAYDDGVRLANSLVKELQEKLRKARASAKVAK